MRRLTLFMKGNVDVHDSLYSCRIGGEIRWNGINELLRGRDVLVRLKHETWTRSDAILAATGTVPAPLSSRSLPLGTYPAPSQFSAALFESNVDAVVMSILGETATELFQHRQDNFLFYPASSEAWPPIDRQWLKSDFSRRALLDVAASMDNLRGIIERIRSRSDVPILIYNVSSIIPGETVHCLQGLGETYSTRCRRFNLALAELSEETGISIVDVDTVIGRAGADRLKLDAMHLTPEGYRLVAEEVVRILEDIGVIPAVEEVSCVQA